jgi:P4 family phage/plasmid primase-like protien
MPTNYDPFMNESEMGFNTSYENKIYDLENLTWLDDMAKKKGVSLTSKKTEPKKEDESKKEEPKYFQTDNANTIKILLDNNFLKDQAKTYPTWFPILCAIYNSVEDKNIGLELAHQFSKLNNYDEDGVNKIWNKFETTPPKPTKTIGSIIYLAKKEDESKYKALFPKKTKKIINVENIQNRIIDDTNIIEQSIQKAIQNSTEYDIAVLLNELNKNKFITTNIQLKEMYVLTDNFLWDKNGSNKARNYISTKLYDVFQLKLNQIYEEFQQEPDLDKQEALTKQIKNLGSLCIKLKKTTDKNNIMRELNEITFNPDFLKTMNRQEYLLPLKNTKIFNLLDNTVRNRTSNDIFNFECGIEYLEEFDESFADKYFNDLFCNKKDLIQVVLNIVKSCLCGKTLRYIFFLTGDGNNGKSLFFELLKLIFGNFVDAISRSVLLTTKATTHLSTEFEKLGICRIGYISEMSNKDELNVPIVKQITGDKYVNVRGICKTDETLEIITNLFCLTNQMPKIDVGKAINNRLIIVPFLNSFELNDEYKPILFSHKNEIFNYIMKYGIVQTKFDFTDEMISSKQECIEDNTQDELQMFIDEKCNLIDGKKILRNEFIKAYNDWLIKNHKDKDKRTTNKFTRDMRSTYKINSKESNHKVFYLDIEWKFVDESEEGDL